MAFRRPKRVKEDSFGTEVHTRTALAGATAEVDLSAASSWKTFKFGNREWQTEAWRLYDIIPEHHFLAGRIGDSIAQARLYVTEVDDTGEETAETQIEEIRRLASIPLGTGAQRDDNLRLSGIDLAVGGECWIVGEGAATNPEKAQGAWFVVTGAALKREGDRTTVKRPRNRGGSRLILTDGVDILIRCWRPHPNDIDQADSFTRAAIVPLREIELLTKREFAELDSRLTGAGVMWVPEGFDFPRGQDDPEGMAGFMAYLQRAVAQSMADQSTARAMVPVLASVPDHLVEHLDKIKPLTFWSELSDQIAPMKVAALARLAVSSELPREVLEGLSTGNHWSAWLITEEGIRWIKGYLQPIADALTQGFLRRALTAMGVANPNKYAFAFDTSTLAARPNRLDDALKLRDQFLLSDEEVVKAGAFDVEQMPSPEERVRQIVLKLLEVKPDLITDPAVQVLLGLPAVAPAIEAAPVPPDDNEDDPSNNDIPDEEDADTEESSSRSIGAALDARINALSARPVLALPSPEAVFNASSKLIVLRALELAGGRLTTPQERRGRWNDVPRHELHHHVGPITPEKAERVTEGAWTHVAVAAQDLGVDPEAFHRLLSGYVAELLTRGVRHHDDLLFAALGIANRGQGLMHPELVLA